MSDHLFKGLEQSFFLLACFNFFYFLAIYIYIYWEGLSAGDSDGADMEIATLPIRLMKIGKDGKRTNTNCNFLLRKLIIADRVSVKMLET